MKPILNFTQCSVTKSGKFIWNEDDTIYGLDVPAWKQKIFEAICENEKECENYCKKKYNGKYLSGKTGKKCYSYHVLANICFVVGYNNLTDSYSYDGGCFENNMHYSLVPAKMDQVYTFDNVKLEIRNKDDPIILAGRYTDFKYDFGQMWV